MRVYWCLSELFKNVCMEPFSLLPLNSKEGEQKNSSFPFFILIYEYFLINFDLFMMKFISCLISERVSEIKNVVQKYQKKKQKDCEEFFLSQLSTKKFFLLITFNNYHQPNLTYSPHTLSSLTMISCHCFIISTSSRDFFLRYLLHTFNFVFFFLLLFFIILPHHFK